MSHLISVVVVTVGLVQKQIIVLHVVDLEINITSWNGGGACLF